MSNKRSAETTIAGYLYQFDKTIIDILNKDTGEYLIEGIEDIDRIPTNGDMELIQIKYHSKKSYNPSEIKKPIWQMLNHFKQVKQGKKQSANYFLYAHFKDDTDKINLVDKKISTQGGKTALDFLKEDLLTYKPTKKKDGVLPPEKKYWKAQNSDDITLNDADLERFIEKLKIKLDAPHIDVQFQEVLEKIKNEIENCEGLVDAENYFYNNALQIIAKKASNDNEDERKITKAKFIEEIDKKKYLFNKWYAWHRGNNDYADFVKRSIRERKADYRSKHRCLFIGAKFLEKTSDDFKPFHLFENIIKSSFDINNALERKDKVWTIVIESDDISDYKRKLLEKNYKYSDGNEDVFFKPTNFMKEPVLNSDATSKIVATEFQVRLIKAKTFIDNFQELHKHIDAILYFSDKDFDNTVNVDKLEIDCLVNIIQPSHYFNSVEHINSIFAQRNIDNDYFRIITVSPTQFEIEVTNPEKFKNKNDKFTLGSYIKITDEFDTSVIGILKNYKIRDINEEQHKLSLQKKMPSFVLDIKPVGFTRRDKQGDDIFSKGGNTITIPPSEVEVAKPELLQSVFKENKVPERAFCFSAIPEKLINYSERISVELNGDKFFNKHLAVVGSTGSGKSCTVAKILHEGIEPTDEQTVGQLNNSHILIFDLHGEYQNSFKDKCRHLTVDKLKLPYWLMNADELEDFFLGTDGVDRVQRSIFKRAVIWNKKYHNPLNNGTSTAPDKKIDDNVTYDTPRYFNIIEVVTFIKNYNNAREKSGTNIPCWIDSDNNELIDRIPTSYDELENDAKLFIEILTPIRTGQTREVKKFNGAFTNFITRLENKVNDDRLDFLTKKGKEYKIELLKIIKYILGYEVEIDEKYDKKNVTIVDLSGFPFEVVNITVAVISRLVFNYAFHWKKYWDFKGGVDDDFTKQDTPFLIVYEEAHNYIPKIGEAKYKAVREAVERIAKEGRKYGVSAMIVSQRPSEISDTIFSQCNSFVVMRLTNPTDQQYIKRLLPEDIGSVTDNLSTFDQREALIIGDAVAMPAIVQIDKLDPDKLPKSNDIEFLQKWRDNWNEMNEFDKIVKDIENND